MPDHRRAGSIGACARLAALAALLGVWLMPAAGHAERVGVVVTAAVNTSRGESERLANALGQALRERLDVDVVAGSEAERRLPPGGVPDTCVIDAACQRDVAGRLGADQLLILAVVRVGKRVQIDTTWVEVSTGRTASRARILVHDSGRPAARVFADAVSHLLPDAGLRSGGAGSRARPDLAAGPDVATGARSQRGSRRFTPGVWVAGSISAGALLAGGAVAFDAARRHRDLEARDCAVIACAPADIDAVDTRARLADALFGVSLVAGITAGVLYWTSAQARPARAARLDPLDMNMRMHVTATRHGLGITWGARF